jgi:carbon storage regulator
MLVISRKKNESIVINDDITIVVVEVRGDKVRLGIEAPKEVPVHRREVFDAIRRNGMAGNVNPNAEKTYLPRFYEKLLMPGESIEHKYINKLERLYN